MEILLTIHHYLDPNAGAAGVTLNLGKEYEKLGIKVSYYSFDNLPEKLPELIKSLLFPEFVAIHIKKLVQHNTVDIVDASTGDAWVWGKLWNRSNHGLPVLATQSHGLEHVGHVQTLAEAQRRKQHLSWKYPLYHGGFRLWEVACSMRCSDLVFMLNQHDADYAISHLNVDINRVNLIPNGIPEAFINLPFEPISESSNSILRIVQVGSYIARKGVQYSVPVLNTILTRYPEVEVSFLGTGCDAEKVYADFAPDVRDRVQVIPSYSHEHLPALLQGHHILLFPSLSEGFPLAIPEAMACGLAPVSSDIPGPTEIVEHETNGLLIPVRDSQAIEHALEKLITNRSYLAQLCRSAYDTAQHYSWAAIAQKRIAIYQAALDRKRQLQ